MDLGAYLTLHRLTLEGFGRRVGVSGVSVHRWVTLKSRPGWKALGAIERVTEGAVTALDFVPREPEPQVMPAVPSEVVP